MSPLLISVTANIVMLVFCCILLWKIERVERKCDIQHDTLAGLNRCIERIMHMLKIDAERLNKTDEILWELKQFFQELVNVKGSRQQ